MKISAINTLSATKLQFGKMNSSKNVSFNGLFQSEKAHSDEPKLDIKIIEHAEKLKEYGVKTANSDAVRLQKEGYEVLAKAQKFHAYCQSLIKNQSAEVEKVREGITDTYFWIDKDNNKISVINKNNAKGYMESLVEITKPDGKKEILLDNENGFKVYRGYKGSFKDGYEAEKVYKYEFPIGKTKEDLVLCTLSEKVKKDKTSKSADRSFNWDVNNPKNVRFITEGIKFQSNNVKYKWPGFIVTIDKRYCFDINTNTLRCTMENIKQDPGKDYRQSKDYSYDSEGKLIDYSDTTKK